jgi:fatty-acyl-CoA synthase
MVEDVNRAELSPLRFLRRAAIAYADKVAVVHGNTGRTYTYREFGERAERLAAGLRAAGVRPGDRVAFLAPNIPPLLEAHFGVPAAGAVLVAINTRLSAGEIEVILRHSGARLLFVDAALQPALAALDVAGLNMNVRIDDTGAPGDPYEDFLAAQRPAPADDLPASEDETIAINYTSGTTGQPKGVMYSHRGAALNALGVASGHDLRGDSVYLWTGPMFHCNGWCFTWGATAVAATHVCLRRVEPDLIWELLASRGVTHCHGAPTIFIGLANHPPARRLEQTVVASIGGAPPSPTLLAQLQRYNIRPIHAYGLTETYGPVTIRELRREWADLPLDEQARLLARQGHPHVNAGRLRVVDGQMRDIQPDGETMGEVVVRGDTVMRGYFRQPEATAEALRGGWFHSGDLAVMHPDGAIELRDRAKDIIISGGENISTIEVEQAIARHPAVLECAVVAIPDERWGERPKAFVTLKPDQTATEAELIAFCREQIAHFKCPAAVAFGDLPKTSTGKIQKYVLRAAEWAGREKRIN